MIEYKYNREWCDDNRDIVNQNQRVVCAANKHMLLKTLGFYYVESIER